MILEDPYSKSGLTIGPRSIRYKGAWSHRIKIMLGFEELVKAPIDCQGLCGARGPRHGPPRVSVYVLTAAGSMRMALLTRQWGNSPEAHSL